MTEIAELTAPNTLKLPPQIAEHFHTNDRFMVWIVSDTLHLKRFTPPAVTEIVAKAPADEPLSMTEINDIVHQVRREQKGS